jgi:hypothetical protein
MAPPVMVYRPMNDITFEERRTAGGGLGPTEFADHRLALQVNWPVRLEVWRE